MGLLDQILGGGGGGGGSGMGAASSQRQSATGSSVLMALLPVVIGMLSHRGGSIGGAGGLGNILGMGGSARDSSSAAGAGALGGLGSLVEMFTQKGYGAQANSWVGTGPNEALPPHAVREVFDEDQISQIAQHAGVSRDDAQNGLSELLPRIVDHFTPQGELPSLDQMSSSVDDFVRRMNSQAG